MSFEYGITTMSDVGKSWDSTGENGWRFRANEAFSVCGFRTLAPNGDTGTTCNLWDVETGALLATAEISPRSEWAEVFLNSAVNLEAGKVYAVTKVCTKIYYYDSAKSKTVFNSKISYITGTFCRPSKGVMPSQTEENYMYPHVDIIIGEPIPLYDKKYLIRSVSTLYTVTDGALSALTETEISASLFQAYGVDEVPDGSLLVGLTDPEVLFWQDSQDNLPPLSLTVTGAPPLPQIITSDPVDLAHESISAIDNVTANASEDVRFSVSFNGGATWLAHDGSTWFQTTETEPGMLASTMNAITTAQWAEVATLTSCLVRAWIPAVTSYVGSVVLHYINP